MDIGYEIRNWISDHLARLRGRERTPLERLTFYRVRESADGRDVAIQNCSTRALYMWWQAGAVIVLAGAGLVWWSVNAPSWATPQEPEPLAPPLAVGVVVIAVGLLYILLGSGTKGPRRITIDRETSQVAIFQPPWTKRYPYASDAPFIGGARTRRVKSGTYHEAVLFLKDGDTARFLLKAARTYGNEPEAEAAAQELRSVFAGYLRAP